MTLLEEIEHPLRRPGHRLRRAQRRRGPHRRAVAVRRDRGRDPLHGQRFINPGAYVHALADSVRERGGKIMTGATVAGVRDTARGVAVSTSEGSTEEFDAVVLATGAWLGQLARQFGVKNVVQAGRGYSFSVEIDHVPSGPVYFPPSAWPARPSGTACASPG